MSSRGKSFLPLLDVRTGLKRIMARDRNHQDAAQAFETEYSHLYGERWPSLKHALQQPAAKSALVRSTTELPQDQIALPFLLNQAYRVVASTESPHYQLDPASIWVAERLVRTLATQSGPYRVLDLCSAPGGKSLAIGFWLEQQGASGDTELHCNEPSATRRGRLKNVLREYLADAPFRITVLGKPGQVFGRAFPDTYDGILVDAPCSSEAHVLNDPSALAEWSPSRSSRLAQQQYRLIEAAIFALKPGASLIYSTCSIHPRENDGVIEKILKRYGDRLSVATADTKSVKMTRGELTHYGVMHLPDQSGLGPLYSTELKRD